MFWLTSETRAAPEFERCGVQPPGVVSVGHITAQEETQGAGWQVRGVVSEVGHAENVELFLANVVKLV